ncbi:N-acyl amino acid synthase FeeM domain-containing protein [Burkholderia gladioli]|uniref:N-acyl amino acid synthase FeeM domain-containing protein n=1 Tax=Burkholderia gladioli TaxID=28095 RepID=UPI002FE10BB3
MDRVSPSLLAVEAPLQASLQIPHQIPLQIPLPAPIVPIADDAPLRSERLPFTIRAVRDEADLERVLAMRRAAYGRHTPEFAAGMTIEAGDRRDDTVLLLAESRLDREAIGTMRIQTNRHGPLPLEGSVVLPDWLDGCRLAEATRLAVRGGMIGRAVKVALCKALFLHCRSAAIDWMVITARAPLDREYQAMLFEDVHGRPEFFPMAHVGGMPHRVLAKRVDAARLRWAEVRHPLYGYVFDTHHPDIDVSVPEA